MKVQEVLTNDKRRYLLIDGNNKPIVPVIRFLKYLDNIGKAENTLKSYCHYLKFYFQFLNEKEKEYKDVDLDLLAEYVSWLRSPLQSTKVVQFQQTKARRSERTVNTMVTCVQSFYDYLMRIEDYEKDLSEKTKKQVIGNHRSFKSFLHHISKGRLAGFVRLCNVDGFNIPCIFDELAIPCTCEEPENNLFSNPPVPGFVTCC